MSMQTPFAAEIPEETRRLVEPLLTADSVCRLVGNEIEQIISDEDFLDMYADEGRPAVNPVVLALANSASCVSTSDQAYAQTSRMAGIWVSTRIMT